MVGFFNFNSTMGKKKKKRYDSSNYRQYFVNNYNQYHVYYATI